MSKSTSAVVFLFLYLFVAIVLTYPLVLNIDSRVLVDSGDPLYNTWVINWNARALLANPLGLFNANIFYPYKNALAFSDVFLAPSVLMMPVLWATKNPLTAYNVLIIFFYAFSAWAVFLLVRDLTQNSYIAFTIGIAYSYSSFHYAHMGHLQLLSDGFFILVVLFLHRYLLTKQFKHIFLAVAFIVVQASSSWYYGIYSLFFLVVFLIFFIAAGRLDYRLVFRQLAPLLAGAALLLVPLAWPYFNFYRTLPQFERTIVEAHYFAARPWSYLTVLPSNIFFGRLFNPFFGRTAGIWEKVLFPGLTVSFFSAWASAAFIFGRRRLKNETGQLKLYYLLLVVLALVLSFGPYLFIGPYRIWLPFRFFYDWLPGFKGMRVPARFALIVTLGMAVLASLGLQDVYRRLERRWSGKGILISFMVILLITVGSQISWPLKLSEKIKSGRNIPKIYRYLTKDKSGGALIELPATKFGSAGEIIEESWIKETKYMYYSLFHWRPIVNGYSGFSPPAYTAIMKEMQNFPSRRSVELLQGLSVRQVLIHSRQLPPLAWSEQKAALASTPGIELEREMEGDYLYRLKGWRSFSSVKAIVIEAVKGPSTAPPGIEVNLGIKLKNITRRPVVVFPDEQPQAEIRWRRGGARERSAPQLPVLLDSRETAWITLQVRTPKKSGRAKLNIAFNSPLIKNRYQTLAMNIDQGLAVSTKPLAKLAAVYRGIIVPERVSAGDRFNLKLIIENAGESLWNSRYTPEMQTKEPINLGEVHPIADWRAAGEPVKLTHQSAQVAFLPYDLGPGDRMEVNFPLQAPQTPGDYELELDTLALGIAHFSDQGSRIIKLPIEVEKLSP